MQTDPSTLPATATVIHHNERGQVSPGQLAEQQTETSIFLETVDYIIALTLHGRKTTEESKKQDFCAFSLCASVVG